MNTFADEFTLVWLLWAVVAAAAVLIFLVTRIHRRRRLDADRWEPPPIRLDHRWLDHTRPEDASEDASLPSIRRFR